MLNSSPDFLFREADPIMTVTLFFLVSETPDDNCFATFLDLWTIFFMSKEILSALKPYASRLLSK